MVKIVEKVIRLVVSGEYDEVTKLQRTFRYHPNNYWMADAFKLFKSTGGAQGWDGYLNPMKLVSWGRGCDTVALIPRGFLDDVVDRATR